MNERQQHGLDQEFGNWKRDLRKGVEKRSSLCDEDANESHILLTRKETKKWTEKLLIKNEDEQTKKLLTKYQSETLELENLCKFLY